jgi:hypothetical protein
MANKGKGWVMDAEELTQEINDHVYTRYELWHEEGAKEQPRVQPRVLVENDLEGTGCSRGER